MNNREDDLQGHFSKFGIVSQTHLVVDKNKKRSKGIAYISYAQTESVARFEYFLAPLFYYLI